MSAEFDYRTGDSFEPSSAALEVSGSGTANLYLPKRIQTITAVSTRYSATDAYQVVDANTYRVVASIVGGVRQPHDLDTIILSPYEWDPYQLTGVWTGSPRIWPIGPRTVKVEGTFGWPAVPDEVKRAVALLVWDRLTARGGDVRRSESWNTGDAQYQALPPESTGMAEVDQIVKRYRRRSAPAVVTMKVG